MVLGQGPDFKARTDLFEREEKARIEAQKNKAAPERLDHRHPDPHRHGSSGSRGLLRRVWQRIRG